LLEGLREYLAEAHARLHFVAQGFVERDDFLVAGPDLEIDLGASETKKPVLRGTDQSGPNALPAILYVDGEVIDPATRTVEASHHGANYVIFQGRDEEQFWLYPLLVADHRLGSIARRVVGKRARPNANQRVVVSRYVGPHLDRVHGASLVESPSNDFGILLARAIR
jgi:hypothetical protein